MKKLDWGIRKGMRAIPLQKPCQSFCKKCGGKDIYRKYYDKGDELYLSIGEDGNKAFKNNPYVKRSMFEVKAKEEHILNRCNTCSFEWAVKPMGLADTSEDIKPGDWVAVVDDSKCTVKLGVGTLWRVERQSDRYPDCWILYGFSSHYPKDIFRKPTIDEMREVGITL